MSLLDQKTKDSLKKKLQKLNALRPLPISAVKKLQEQFRIEMTYNSNAIEGNSLTLQETFLVIREGLTVKGKPLKDHLEAKDHEAALQYLYEVVEKERSMTLSEQSIRSLHQLVIQGTEKEWAGRYRNSPVIITGAAHKPPDAFEIPVKMEELLYWFHKNEKKVHPVEMAALIHHRLAHIHPFFDGNGRTARLLMNLLLMRAGYPLSIILKNDRKKYYRVLKEADDGKSGPMVQFVAQSVQRSLDIYLKTLTPSLPPSLQIRENFRPLSEISKKTKYSAKYLNLLVRQGKLEAHKQGRNWLTTPAALEKYVRERLRKR